MEGLWRIMADWGGLGAIGLLVKLVMVHWIIKHWVIDHVQSV